MNMELIISGFFLGCSIVLFSHLGKLRKELRDLQGKNDELTLKNEGLKRRISHLNRANDNLFLALVTQITKRPINLAPAEE